jgi:hypothetical protein
MGLDEPAEKLFRDQVSGVDLNGSQATVAGTGDREPAVGREVPRGRRS